MNYGTGTPSLAASWVQAAASDNVQYWEVGNEVYGNGTYGANWEADAHCDTSLNGSPVTIGSEPSQTYNCGPAQYAANFLQFESAVHAVNANAKVCAVLTTPGFWPDGVTNSEYPQSWNQTVLSALKSGTQCVIVHYYPGGSSTAGMLTDPSDIAGIVSTLHSEISSYAGISDPASVPIIVTETNSTIDLDTQPAALFGADMYMTWLENGVANVDWWNEHNGEGTVSTVDGATDYGDQGIFSNNSNSGGTTEPAPRHPVRALLRHRDAVQARGAGGHHGHVDLLAVPAQGARRPRRQRQPQRADRQRGPVQLLHGQPRLQRLHPVRHPHGVHARQQWDVDHQRVRFGEFGDRRPYSLTVVHIPGSGGSGVTAPGAPGQPTVSGLSSSTSSNTSGTATIGWPAAAAGTYPIAKYNLYNSSGTLVTSATGTSVTLERPDHRHLLHL